jgi:glycolate dehydrogenase FAD-binding subunit
MADSQQISNDLFGTIGVAGIKIDPEVLAGYSVDGIVPKAVIFPKDTQEVSEVVTYANQKNLAVVAWGSGSKMNMGNPPERLDLVVCTSRMNHMKDVDTANLTLTVEAGVKFRDVQARLATEEDRCYLPLEDLTTEADDMICSDRENKGSFLPIDPPFSDRATIGGMVATNSSGPRRLLYNNPRDVIIGVRFVSPTGDIVGMGGKTVKNVSGYDVSKLMVGSMGTLGILCDMTLRLLPLPERMETLLISFDALAGVSDFSNRIFETRLLPAAVEVLNREAFEQMGIGASSGFAPGRYIAAVALEAYHEAVDRMKKEMLEMAAVCGASGNLALQEAHHGRFWFKIGNLALSAAEKYTGLLTLHLNYQISNWKEIFELAEQALSAENIPHTLQAHTGIGVCKLNLLVAREDTNRTNKAVDIIDRLMARCLQAGGNLAVHNAPVDVKPRLKIWGEEGSDIGLIKRVKEHLDPAGIMSPGRFVGNL